jgi:hypothetical protein
MVDSNHGGDLGSAVFDQPDARYAGFVQGLERRRTVANAAPILPQIWVDGRKILQLGPDAKSCGWLLYAEQVLTKPYRGDTLSGAGLFPQQFQQSSVGDVGGFHVYAVLL